MAKRKTKRTRRIVLLDGPDPVDVHVGAQVHRLRILAGMSQTVLGEHLGLTFQQVRKNEKGWNRIGASRLWELSQLFNVPVAEFFEGLGKPGPRPKTAQLKLEDLQLIRYYSACPPAIQKEIMGLLRAAGRTSDTKPKRKRRKGMMVGGGKRE